MRRMPNTAAYAAIMRVTTMTPSNGSRRLSGDDDRVVLRFTAAHSVGGLRPRAGVGSTERGRSFIESV